MNILKGLTSSVRSIISEEFRRGDIKSLDLSAYLTEIKFDRSISLEPLSELIITAMNKFGNEPSKSDPWLGPRVHSALRLTRREAAEKALWQYLTVVEFPNYVRWRWGNDENEKAAPLDRFFGEDSKNSLARLWWAAELTRNGADYSRTTTALGISRFFVSWQHLILMHHRPCALAVVDFLAKLQKAGTADADGQIMAKALNAVLRTVSIDMMVPNPAIDTDTIREWISQNIDATLMFDKLPLGPDEARVSEEDIEIILSFLETLAGRINLSFSSVLRGVRGPNQEKRATVK